MIRKAAIYRLSTYSSGAILQIITLYLIIKYLEIYQFAIWGVANSFIFVFSIIGQAGFGQNIEKYFPNYKSKLRNILFFKFLKSIILFIPVWYFVLFLFNYLGYFAKYNANNLFILFLIIAFSSVSESLIQIFKSFLLIENLTKEYDLIDLFYGKVLKIIIFAILLTYGFSVYYLLFFNLIFRIFEIFHLMKIKNLLNYETLKNIITVKLSKDTFINFKYNIFAFLDKAFYVSFINVLFLISTIFTENLEISHFSIAILIINNLRPVMGSLSSLISPIISRNINQNISSKKISNSVIVTNSIFVTVVINVALFLVNKHFLYDDLFFQYDIGIYKIIFTGVIASCLNSLYFPSYIENLYSNKERKMVVFTIINQIICVLLYLILKDIVLNNFIILFLFYEFNNYIFNTILLNRNKKLFNVAISNLRNLRISLFVTILTVVFYFLDIYLYTFQIAITILLLIDSIYVKKKILS